MGKPFKQIFLETTILIDLAMYINNDLIIKKIYIMCFMLGECCYYGLTVITGRFAVS
jgi:hypothetical protein